MLGLEPVVGAEVLSLALEGGELRYEQAAEGELDRFAGFEIECENPAPALARAKKRGLPMIGEDAVQIGGVAIGLVKV